MSENTMLLFEIEEDEPVVDIDKQWEERLKKSEPEKNKIENITLINDADKLLEEFVKLDKSQLDWEDWEECNKKSEPKHTPYRYRHDYYDHLGNKFFSVGEMCEHWDVDERSYKNRISTGWTVGQALTTPVDPYKPIIDHIGNTFSSVAKFCDYWKICGLTYYEIVECAKLFEDFLTPVPCKDHLGNEFPHDKAMCDYYGITRDTYARRLSKGDSLEEALRPMPNHECYDHLGNYFQSRWDMCLYWNVSVGTVENRLRRGCDIETALTAERKCSFLEVTVKNYLSDKNADFDVEYVFNDCVFVDTNRSARFDFHIPEVGIIEVDGEQHFKPVEIWGGEEHLKKNQDHDAIKTAYCEENNIPLLRIRYDQLKNDVYKSMIDDFLANPDKYIKNHNTYMTEEEYYGAA